MRVVFGTAVNVNAANFPFVYLQNGPNARIVASLVQAGANRINVVPLFQAGTQNQIMHSGRGSNAMGQTPAGVRVGSFTRPVVI